MTFRTFLKAGRLLIVALILSGATDRVRAVEVTHCFTYPAFSPTNGFSLAGAATVTTNFIRLTPATNIQLGGAWRSQKVYCAGGFTTEFRFRMLSAGSFSGYEQGGDGLSFCFQNDSLISNGTEYGGTNKSLGVSFNTFHNIGLEPNGNFVGIMKMMNNTTTRLLQQPFNNSLFNDGAEHVAQIQFDGTNITVAVDGVTTVNQFSIAAHLASALDTNGYAWVGFGGRNGGVGWQTHDILSWSFCGAAPPAPTIITHPTNWTAYAGSSATFRVTASGAAPLSYQWWHDGDPLASATGSVLTLNNVQSVNAGTYYATVANNYGSVTSSNAQLTLIAPPITNCFTYPDFGSSNSLALAGVAELVANFTRLTPATSIQLGAAWHPQKVRCANGFTTEFRFRMLSAGSIPGYEPSGDGLSFCFQNESTLSNGSEYGATNNSIAISFNTFYNPGLEPNGNFVGIIKATSSAPETRLLQQPFDDVIFNDGAEHVAQIHFDGANLTVVVDGIIAVNQFPVGANVNVALDADGDSWVGFGGRNGGVGWQTHDILSWSFCTITPAIPIIATQPTNVVTITGGSALFAVVAAGAPPLNYQWRHNGNPLAGATDRVLTLNYAQIGNAGAYSVTVTNEHGSVTSSNAQLTVVPPVVTNCFTYPNFNSSNSLALAGVAATVDNFTRLTPATNIQLGAAWHPLKVYCIGGFSTEFRFRMLSAGSFSGYEPGGDGLSFCFQNESTLSIGSEFGATNNSLGISFNTFYNYGLEPNGNFVGIMKMTTSAPETRLLQQPFNAFLFNDGAEHTAQIQFDGTNLTVRVDGIIAINQFPISPSVALDSSGYSWVGFGGRNGGVGWQTHDILSWSFCGNVPPATGAPRHLSATLESDERIRLRVTAGAYTSHIIQTSTNLVDWQNLRQMLSDGNGNCEAIEAIDGALPQRFYRIAP